MVTVMAVNVLTQELALPFWFRVTHLLLLPLLS